MFLAKWKNVGTPVGPLIVAREKRDLHVRWVNNRVVKLNLDGQIQGVPRLLRKDAG